MSNQRMKLFVPPQECFKKAFLPFFALHTCIDCFWGERFMLKKLQNIYKKVVSK